MRYTINTALFVIFILLISVCISQLANYLSTDQQIVKRLAETSKRNLEWKERRKKLRVDNGTDHLMWFVQISDIHISVLRDQARQADLHNFVTKTLDVIKPPVVVASGDLTDARAENPLGSHQFKKEWEIYQSILKDNNVAGKTLWLDIRGNHDTFNVPDVNSEWNYFKNYSMQGPSHQKSYMTQVTVGSEKYSFIAIDACQEPGTKRPFNFIGIMTVNQTNTIINLAESSRKSGADYIIWFGHYPTSTILSPGTGNRGIRGILGQYDEGYIYLSGHLHTLGGMVKRMYALQDTNFLELELGDWKDNRMFRVAAFDHGLFSFVDVKHNAWPIILITNPKDSLINIEKKENPALQLQSTHIRILVFDPHEIDNCSVRIDDGHWESCRPVTKNLFVKPWNPANYKTGHHKIDVSVRTEDGREKMISQQFAVDGSNRGFPIGAKLILKYSLTKIFQTMFGFALSLCVVPICILRIWHELVHSKKVQKPDLRSTALRRFIRKMWIMSTVNWMFYPYLLLALYVLIGPWSVGHVIDGHIGVVFSWGMFVNGHFLPGTLSYLYGYFQLMFCNFPLLFIYSQIIWNRYKELLGYKIRKEPTTLKKVMSYLPFGAVLITEILLAVFFWRVYGPLSAFLGPMRTWSIGIHCGLFYWAKTLPKAALRSAIDIAD